MAHKYSVCQCFVRWARAIFKRNILRIFRDRCISLVLYFDRIGVPINLTFKIRVLVSIFLNTLIWFTWCVRVLNIFTQWFTAPLGFIIPHYSNRMPSTVALICKGFRRTKNKKIVRYIIICRCCWVKDCILIVENMIY